MSEPIVITDEMRKAVLAEICQNEGHMADISSAFRFDDSNRPDILSEDPEKLPHIICRRCEKTWIVIPDPGDGYDDAEMRVRDRLYKADELNKRPERPRSSGRQGRG